MKRGAEARSLKMLSQHRQLPTCRTRPSCCALAERGHAAAAAPRRERRSRRWIISISYSIASSARVSSVRGISRLSVFAVVRLMTNWNFVGSSIDATAARVGRRNGKSGGHSSAG
jgi:hypothetical protein